MSNIALGRTMSTTAAAVSIAVVTAACGGGEVPASGDVSTEAGGAGATQVTAVDNEFAPEVLELPAGEPATVSVTNEGDAAHNFVIQQLDVSSGTIQSGDTVTATFEVPADGVDFVCTFHPGMKGRIEATS